MENGFVAKRESSLETLQHLLPFRIFQKPFFKTAIGWWGKRIDKVAQIKTSSRRRFYHVDEEVFAGDMGDTKGGFWANPISRCRQLLKPKSCPGAVTCVPVRRMCVAVLHNVIIGADKTPLERQSSIAPISGEYLVS